MKKIISIFIVLSLCLTMLPNLALAETTTIPASADCEVYGHTNQYQNNQNTTLHTDGTMDLYSKFNENKATKTSKAMAYYTFELPPISEGKTITNATLKLYVKPDATGDRWIRLYNVYDSWNETEITWDNQPLEINGDLGASDIVNETRYKYAGYPVGTPDMELNIWGTKKNALEAETIDITPLVRNFLNSNPTDNKFSFVLAQWVSTLDASHLYIAPREHENSEYHPSLTLDIEEIPAFEFESVTPVSGAKIGTDDVVTFTFNNNIDPESVDEKDFTVTDISGKVVNDFDFEVSANTIKVRKAWDAYGYYKVKLSGIKDVYGGNLTGTYSTSFEVNGSGETTSTKILSKDILQMESTDNTAGEYKLPDYNSYNIIRGKNSTTNAARYTLYQFDLSEVDSTKQVVSATFSLKSSAANAPASVSKVTDYTWENTSGSDASYFTALVADYDNVENQITVTDMGSASAPFEKTVDITAAVNDAMSGNKKVTFAVKTNYNLYDRNSKEANHPYLTVEVMDKSFDVIKSVPAKGDSISGVNDEIKLTLGTTIAPAFATNEYIKMYKVSDNSEVAIDITSNASTYTISPKADLAERTEYKIVLMNGIEDVSGTTLPSDKAVFVFTSGTALEFGKIKFTLDKTAEYDDADEIANYSAGDEVTAVAQFVNKSSTDLDAIMIIAIYNADGSIIEVDAYGGPACAPGNQTTQYSKTITVPSDATGTYIKSFIWNNLTNIRPLCEVETIPQAN